MKILFGKKKCRVMKNLASLPPMSFYGDVEKIDADDANDANDADDANITRENVAKNARESH